MAQDLQVIAPSLPPGSCYDNNLLVLLGKIRVILPNEISFFIISPNEPTVEQRDQLWVKTNSLTGAIVGLFTWSANYGLWIKPHFNGTTVPINERRIYVGSLSSLETYDGGSPGTVTDTTGPFWQQDTNWTDKFIVGAGTTAVDADNAAGYTPGGAGTTRGAYIIKPTGRIYDRST
jgi:hypothetical protein